MDDVDTKANCYAALQGGEGVKILSKSALRFPKQQVPQQPPKSKISTFELENFKTTAAKHSK